MIGGTYIVVSAVSGYAKCIPLIKVKYIDERWLSAILAVSTRIFNPRKEISYHLELSR
jgi:hypothetical protein